MSIRYLDDYEEQCKRCKGECGVEGMSGCIVCNGYVPMTNADCIRSMTDEELTEFLNHIAQCCENECCVGCPLYNACCKNIKIEDWLKQECRC